MFSVSLLSESSVEMLHSATLDTKASFNENLDFLITITGLEFVD